MWDHVSTVRKSSVDLLLSLSREDRRGYSCRAVLPAGIDVSVFTSWMRVLMDGFSNPGAFEPIKYNLAVRPQCDSCNLQFVKILS